MSLPSDHTACALQEWSRFTDGSLLRALTSAASSTGRFGLLPECSTASFGLMCVTRGRSTSRRKVAPDAVTTAWWKEERGSKVFVDFNQANRDRTMAGAYSPRALPHASVSCPVTWDELESVDPRSFTVLTVPDRIADVGDPWSDFDEKPGSIDVLLSWWQRDLENGLGELPFPPDYPKMPGEPPRVQPSKKVAGNWDEDGNRVDAD